MLQVSSVGEEMSYLSPVIQGEFVFFINNIIIFGAERIEMTLKFSKTPGLLNGLGPQIQIISNPQYSFKRTPT